MRRHNALKDIKDELSRVDQRKHEEALFTLRHSSAARDVFCRMQYVMALGVDELHEFTEMEAYGTTLACISREVLLDHWWARSRLNPNRIFAAHSCDFEDLANDLGIEKHNDEYGETFVKTLDGWWMV